LKFKLTARGGQSPQYFIDLAAQLGYAVTIDEFSAFRCDTHRVDTEPLNSWEWDFVWRVNAPPVAITYFRADESRVGEKLVTWSGTDRLECPIRKRKPAHTIVLFNYS
jgi:uncharacterized protein YmfQ (DUF2313 family)